MSTAVSSSTAAVAHELVDLCRAGKHQEAVDKLYSRDIVSIEPVGNDKMPAKMTGIDAIRKKNQWWVENTEVHSEQVNGPLIGEDQFAVEYTFDATQKQTGRRGEMTEMALYTVKDNKIVREQFFYHMPGM